LQYVGVSTFEQQTGVTANLAETKQSHIIQYRGCYHQSTMVDVLWHSVIQVNWNYNWTRKPCCCKETARCRKCSFRLKFANNIPYK